MKKMYFFLTLCLAFIGLTANAQITSVAELTNGKCYTVTNKRTAWAVDAAQGLKSLKDLGLSADATSSAQQFAFVSHDEGATHYLYSVGAKSFINKDGSLGSKPVDPVLFANGATANTFVVYFDTSHYINCGGSNQMIIDTWSIADDGNSNSIVAVADFDATEALDAFFPFELVSVEPATEVVGEFAQLTLTFSQDIQKSSDVYAGALVYFNGEVVSNTTIDVKGNQAVIYLDNTQTALGEYEVYLTEGLFTTLDGKKQSAEMTHKVSIVEPAIELVSITPAEGEVKSLTNFKLTFNQPVKLSESDEVGAMLMLNGMPACGTLLEVNPDNAAEVNVLVDMGEMTMEGVYTLYFMEGTFLTLGETATSPEMMFNWNVVAPLEVVSVAPEQGNLEYVGQFTLTFNKEVTVVENDEVGAMLLYGGSPVCGTLIEVNPEDAKVVTISLPQEYAIPGDYMLYIMEGTFTTTDGALVSPELMYNWTVVTPELKKVTDVAELSNRRAYHLVSKDTARGALYAAYKATMVDMCGVTYSFGNAYADVAVNAEDPTQQFAIVEYNGKHYLYSVLNKTFVSKNGDINKLGAANINDFVVVNEEVDAAGEGYFSINLAGQAYMTASPGWQANKGTCNITTLTNQDPNSGWDDGAWYTITEAAVFDATEALAMLEAANKTTVEISPAPSENAESLPTTISLTFSANIGNVEFAMVRTNNTGFRGLMLEAGDHYTIDGNVMTIFLSPDVVAYAPYLTLYVQVTDEDGKYVGYADQEEVINATWITQVPSNIFQLTEVTPAANSDVEALETFEIMFSHPTGQSYIGGVDATKQIVLKNEAGEVVANGTVVLNEEEFFAPAKIVLDKKVKTVGTYTLVIPEGTFYNESYNPEQEDLGVAEYGAIYNPETTLTYNVIVPTRYFYHVAYNGLLQMAADGSVASLVDASNVDDVTAYGWQLIAATDAEGNEIENQYKIYNVATQLYLGACNTSQNVLGVAAENAVTYEWKHDGQYDVFQDMQLAGDYNFMHIAGHNALVGWSADAGASHWFVLNSAEELQTVLANRALETTLAEKVAKATKAKELSQPYFKPLITSATQFNSNNKEQIEGSYEALLDGDATTFFHSNWHGGGVEPHDLQVTLNDNDLTAFLVKYVSRNSSGFRNDRPTHMKIYGGKKQEDGSIVYNETHFAELTTADGIGEVEGEFKFTADDVYDAFRFEVLETVMTDGSKGKVWFTYGEFQMYSQEMSPAVIELTEEEAEAIDVAVEAAQNAHLVNDNYAELVAALDAAIIDAYNYDYVTMALVDEAKAILATTGVGYPTLEAEARATFQAVIDAVDAEPTAEAGETLQAAIEAYCGTTDVALPAAGKYYTFTMVAKNGNKFYLNYTGSDVAMVAREEGVELPESAMFLAEINEDGTYSFTTLDGNYLVYHSKYAGVNWLAEASTTGFVSEKTAMASIELAKMVNGSNVSANNNRQIFGLLTWKGMRGYKNGAPEYGYMVLKADGSDYDGATVPFWNDNFSSGFLVEEAAGPALFADPAPGFYEEALPTTVKLTFPGGIQSVDFAMVRTATSLRGNMLDESNYTVEGNVLTVTIPEEYLSGSAYYMLTLQIVDNNGNYVTYGDSEDYVNLMYETTPRVDLFECTEIDPAEGEVTELEQFTLSFFYQGMWDASYIGGFDTTKEITLKDAEGNVVAKGTIDFQNPEEFNALAVVTLDAKVTEAGVYTLNVPAATVYNEGYYPEAEDLGVSWGAVYNPELNFTYTVVGQAVDQYPINFDKDADATRTDRVISSVGLGDQSLAIDNATKAYIDLTTGENKFVCVAGSTVTPTFGYSGVWMHGYVYVDFGNDGAFSFDETVNDQTGLDLVSYSFYGVESENEGYNSVGDYITGNDRNTIMCPAFKVPETPGEYRIRFKVDWNSVDAGGCVLASNHILNNGGYIVDAILVVTENSGIENVTIDGAKDAYTIDGRKVNAKKLNKGIYVVNGKKVYVK